MVFVGVSGQFSLSTTLELELRYMMILIEVSGYFNCFKSTLQLHLFYLAVLTGVPGYVNHPKTILELYLVLFDANGCCCRIIGNNENIKVSK